VGIGGPCQPAGRDRRVLTQHRWGRIGSHPDRSVLTFAESFEGVATMLYRLAAEAVLLFHLAFIVFVVAGGALAARWRWVVLVHLPVAAWGFFVELTGRVCPLTPAENYLRHRAGQSGYAQSFVEHYLLAIVYPEGLTREAQFVLAGGVVIVNLAIYGWLLLRRGPSRDA
ncbi:MAG TPA: DUF2784 domain-containing protein, partial [Ramlibacter sp.]|nr:DUF2784 domain-containing protein [Ramlibacter sp.]